MAHVIITHTVKDYGTWKPIFDEDAARRRSAGSTGVSLYRDADDPNTLTALVEFPTLEQARAFANDAELAQVMGNAGVIGRPEVSFVNFEEKQAS